MRALIWIITHTARKVGAAPSALRQSGALDVVKKFSSSSDAVTRKVVLNNLAAVMTDAQYAEYICPELKIRMNRWKESPSDQEYLRSVSVAGETDKLRIVADALVDLGSVQLFKDTYSQYFYSDLCDESISNITSILWNNAFVSVRTGKEIIDSGTHEDMLKYLNSEVLGPNVTTGAEIATVDGLLNILHNIINLVEGAPSILRECNGVEIIQRYLQSSMLKIRCISELILAYVMTEKQYEERCADDQNISVLVEMLSNAVAHPEHSYDGFSIVELVQGLNKIAVSDSNKIKLIELKVLKSYTELLKPEYSRDETYRALRGLWTLSFKCADDITKEPGCVEAINDLVEHSDAEVRQQAKGALWKIKGENEVTQAATAQIDTAQADESPHVFISYQWSSQKTMIRVKDRLKENGYQVWMDIEAMSGSILEAMARAVERAAVVIVCMSQLYKDSPNCRTEGEYTYSRHRSIIPLRLQPKYIADGWLGALVTNKMWIDFSNDSRFEDSMMRLIKELGDRGKPANSTGLIVASSTLEMSSSVSAKSSTTRTTPVTTSVASWSTEKVCEWLESIDLHPRTNWFNGIDGKLLLGLKNLYLSAPESYHNTLQGELHLSLKERIILTEALNRLS